MTTIPDQLRTPDFRFIVLPKGKKGGGNEPNWQTTANYAHDSPKLLAHIEAGGNYGVFPARGSPVTILDADAYDACREAGLLQGIEGHTFTVETGGSVEGGRKYHFYFLCDPPFEGKRPLFNDDGVHLGEIYCQHPESAKGYVVGPGSVHPSGEPYRVVMNLPLATANRVDLGIALSRLSVEKKGAETAKDAAHGTNGTKPIGEGASLANRLGVRVTDVLMPVKATHRNGEWIGTHPVHGSDTGTNLTIDHEKWYCRRCGSGGGGLEAIAVAEGIIQCAEAGPGCLWPDKWEAVIDALVKRGYDLPDADAQKQRARRAMGIAEGGALAGGEHSAREEPKKTTTPKKKDEKTDDNPFVYKHPKFGWSVDVEGVADHLSKELHIISFRDVLYVYHDGVYTKNVGQIEGKVRTILVGGGTKEQLTRISREVIAHLKATDPLEDYPFNQVRNAIPVENGVLHIDYATATVTRTPHDPSYRFTYKLPVIYDPTADGAAFHENVIAPYVDDDEASVLYQIPATALLQAHGDKPYKRAYILHGDTNGGKSTYLEILTAFFGKVNVSGIALQNVGDRFVNGAMEGKILNISDDLEDVPLQNVGQFKTLTGIFDHHIENKHQTPYRGRITAVHLFTCNAPPEVPERFRYDDAFWVRWVYVNFENVFDVDPTFNARWITPENMSGFLNLVLEAMIYIQRHGLMVAPDASETKSAWNVAADPFARFIAMEMRAADKENKFNKEALLKTFVKWCEDQNIPARKIPRTMNAFTRLAFKNDFRTARSGTDNWYAARKQFNSGSAYQPTAEDEAAGSNLTLAVEGLA